MMAMCNDWLEERRAMVGWEEKEWTEGGFGFVARTVGRSGRWVDVVELRVEQVRRATLVISMILTSLFTRKEAPLQRPPPVHSSGRRSGRRGEATRSSLAP